MIPAALEQRVALARPLRRALNFVFPDAWAYLLGEIALYCFAVLVLTGTYLSFFYDPSMKEIIYNGSYVPLRDVSMSQAYASTLHISFDVRGGLLVRQVHHWAALLFMAAVVMHLFRTFFMGAFRKPRELTWLGGVVILMFCLLEGFSGYTLPDDIISGASLRIAESIILSIPLIGTWVAFLIFNGNYPGESIIPRLYIVHVFVTPALLVALIGLHVGLVLRQRHTRPPGRGSSRGSRRRSRNVRAFPAYAVRSGALFCFVGGVLAGLGGLAQINPVWLYGPYEPAYVSSNSQPDWYTFFLEGALRFFPPWEIRAGGYTVPAVFWPGAVLPAGMLLIAGAYPWIEAKLARDRRSYQQATRPRDAPLRTAVGAAGLSFYVVLALGATDDFIAKTFEVDIEIVVWAGRVGVVVIPLAAFLITRRICLRLQAREQELIRSGVPTGIVQRSPEGEWAELVETTRD